MPLFPQLYGKINSLILHSLLGRLMAGKKNINYDSLIGKKYARWTIVGYLSAKRCVMLQCICECGRKSSIQSNALLHFRSKSCLSCAPKKHGYHGTSTNRSWNAAKNRCNNPNNKDYGSYGGRGIKMCDRWNDFRNFLSDMGEKPEGKSLDRINNDGDYEPNNCRWATRSEQNSNQRKRTGKVK